VALLALRPAWAPGGAFGSAGDWLAALALTSLAALGRPAGGAGLLGFGTVAVVPALVLWGPVAASTLAAAAAVVADLLRRWIETLWRETPLPERRRLGRVLAHASTAGLGALAAGAVWRIAFAEPPEAAAVTAGLVALCAVAYLVPGAGLELLTRRARRHEHGPSLVEGLLPLSGEIPGFAIGYLLVALVARAGWGFASAWAVVVALLAGEAARRELAGDAARRRYAEAVRLSRAGASIATGGSELARLARQIFTECAAIIPYAYAQMEIAGPDVGTVRYWAGPDGEPRDGAPDPPAYPPPLPGFHRREPWRILDERLLDESEREARLRLWCDGRRLDARAESGLVALLPQMAASVRGALLDREATVDRLTGAATRRALERRLTGAFAAAEAEGRPLSLVLCDLDHFKRINDTFGHAHGDRALEAAAGVLLGPSRGGDFCARYGGEEFVLVLEGVTADDALEIAERLRRRVEALDLRADGERIGLTMSFGVAAYPELAVRSAEELLEFADGALYTAKHLGRNLAVLDLGGGRMRTGAGQTLEITEAPPTEPPVFFA